LAANLLSPLPYSVAVHNSRALRRAVQDFAAHHPVDLWHCEWTPYARALRGIGKAPQVIMAHNIESQLWQRYQDHERNPVKRWFMRQQLRKFLRFEYQAFSTAEATIAVSQDDADLARFALGARHVEIVDNGVDLDYFQPPCDHRRTNSVLFLGSLDWRPNLDGIELLLNEIWPLVRAQTPAATLQIVGRNPPHWLLRRARKMAGVEVHGTVPDVRPFLTGCSLLAVPLRIAGGSRLKILEALACATPVVSTTVGAEGLRLEADHHITLADGTEAMATALVRALQEPELIQAQAWRGREVVSQHYGWDVLADRLSRVWQHCVAGVSVQERK
jgi:polysaccharide biosynthesis protein PslH